MKASRKILLIEDDEILSNLYFDSLTEAKYHVDLARDGEQAIQKLEQGGYDLVLLDLFLPKYNGKEILEKISNSPPKKPNKKIVCMTNMSEDEAKTDLEKYHIADFIIKAHYTPKTFIEKITKLLS